MKRKLTGEVKVVGYYSVAWGECFYILPFEVAWNWELKRGYDAIAILWQGKLYFRKLYYRMNKSEYCFKFFNCWFYLCEIEHTEGTHAYIQV